MDQAANLEGFIRQHCPWEQLPPAVRQSFDNNRALWEKEVCAFSLRNQLPWRTSLVRKFILDERKYYSDMLRTSRERLMVRHHSVKGRRLNRRADPSVARCTSIESAPALSVPPGRHHRARPAGHAVPVLPGDDVRAHAPRPHLRHPAQLYGQGLCVRNSKHAVPRGSA